MKDSIADEQQLNHFREPLKKFQIFTDEEWTLFSAAISFKMLKKKEILVHTGDVYQAMAFVHEGAVRFFTERGGEITTIYFSFKGELITSYNSFITGNPSSIGLEAIEKTFVLVLTQQSLAVLAVNPVMAFKIEQMRRKIAEYYILCYEDRIGSFLFQNQKKDILPY